MNDQARTLLWAFFSLAVGKCRNFHVAPSNLSSCICLTGAKQEGEGEHCHERMAVETLPGSPFEVIEAKFLFQLLMGLLANPSCLDGGRQGTQTGRRLWSPMPGRAAPPCWNSLRRAHRHPGIGYTPLGTSDDPSATRRKRQSDTLVLPSRPRAGGGTGRTALAPSPPFPKFESYQAASSSL
jgi:hypothetical protein